MAQLDNYMDRKRAAIAAREADWSAAPEKAVTRIAASARCAGITGARPTRMGEHIIVSDSGPGLAGHALGPTSPEMLLGALASCLVHTYLIQAAMLAIALDSVEVEVSGTLYYKTVIGMASPYPPQLVDIEYRAHIDCQTGTEALERLHTAVEVGCPVLNTLRQPMVVARKA